MTAIGQEQINRLLQELLVHQRRFTGSKSLVIVLLVSATFGLWFRRHEPQVWVLASCLAVIAVLMLWSFFSAVEVGEEELILISPLGLKRVIPYRDIASVRNSWGFFRIRDHNGRLRYWKSMDSLENSGDLQAIIWCKSQCFIEEKRRCEIEEACAALK